MSQSSGKNLRLEGQQGGAKIGVEKRLWGLHTEVHRLYHQNEAYLGILQNNTQAHRNDIGSTLLEFCKRNKRGRGLMKFK